MNSSLREYAETPDRFTQLPEGVSVSRFDDGRVCVLQGTTWASVSGVTVGDDDVAALVEQVRELVPAGKPCSWWFGPSSRPSNLRERLLAQGLAFPENGVDLVKTLVLTDEPPAIPSEIDVRRIETLEDFLVAREILWEAFDVPPERRELQQAHLEEEFTEMIEHRFPVDFLALLEGRPAATATAIPSGRGLFLVAGSTMPWARGRGLYRALVRKRWDYAVEQGTPALVTQAVPGTSYPILKRLGFKDVCDTYRLEDPR
jgi:hypothetical protein